MSTNIEDLLQSDSDDESNSHGSGALDLEILLEKDDEDDDDDQDLLIALKTKALAGLSAPMATPSPLILPSNPQTRLIISSAEGKSVNADVEALLSEDLSPVSPKAVPVQATQTSAPPLDGLSDRPTVPTNPRLLSANMPLPPSLAEIFGQVLPPSSDPIVSLSGTASTFIPSVPTPITEVASLKLCEQRELRTLTVDKSSQSALQLRRTTPHSSGASSPIPSSSSALLDELSTVSGQLRRNAQYAQHGPGTATALCANAQFSAVGTARGCVLIFDGQQELRRVLTPPASSLSVPLTAAEARVSALDSIADGSVLVAGYASGDVLFWDTSRGTVLKPVRDPAGGIIRQVAFLPSVGFPDLRTNSSLADSETFLCVVVTQRGVVNRYKFTRSLLSSWHCEVDCLLDDSHSLGKLFDVAVLRPLGEYLVRDPVPSHVPRSAAINNHPSASTDDAPIDLNDKEYSDLRSYPALAMYLALSFERQTQIVQIMPEVKLAFKWAVGETTQSTPAVDGTATSHSSSEHKFDSSKQVDSSAVDIRLDWTWLYLSCKPVPTAIDDNLLEMDIDEDQRAHEAQVNVIGVWTPVLCRANGSQIELLAMRAKTTSRDKDKEKDPEPKDQPARRTSIFANLSMSLSSLSVVAEVPTISFDFAPVAVKSVLTKPVERILTVKWLHCNQAIVFTESKVLVLDASLATLETQSVPLNMNSAFQNSDGKSQSAGSEITPQFAIAKRELQILLSQSLLKVVARSPFERADGLIIAGKWLEGLSLVVETITRSPLLLQSERECVQSYISQYAALALKRDRSLSLSSSRTHFSLVAAVCVEFCVSTKNLRLLFRELYELFRRESQQQTLLEALEPFILRRDITSLPPRIVSEFLSVAVQAKRMRTIERCLSYFDPMSLDLHFVANFLFSHKLISPFLFVFSRGLNDFAAAAQIVLQELMATAPSESVIDKHDVLALSSEDDHFTDNAHKLLLFMLFTFNDRIFPKGEQATTPVQTVSSLLRFLTQDRMQPMRALSSQSADLSSAGEISNYPVLRTLCRADSVATIFVACVGASKLWDLIERERRECTVDVSAEARVSFDADLDREKLRAARVSYEQTLTSSLNDLQLFAKQFDEASRGSSLEALFLSQSLGLFCNLQLGLSMDLFESLCRFSAKQPIEQRMFYEKALMQCAERQSRFFPLRELQRILKDSKFFFSAVSVSRNLSLATAEQLVRDFRIGLAHYLTISKQLTKTNSANKPLNASADTQSKRDALDGWEIVFDYVTAQFVVVESPIVEIEMSSESAEKDRQSIRSALRTAVVNEIIALAAIDVPRTSALLLQSCSLSLKDALQRSESDSALAYALFKRVFTDWKQSRSEESVAAELLDSQSLSRYLKLIATHEPEAALPFLLEFREYCALDDCLQIARECSLADAASYLLERSGDVESALQTLLKDVSQRARQARREVDTQLRSEARESLTISTGRVLLSQLIVKQASPQLIAESLWKLAGCKSLRRLVESLGDLCERQQHEKRELWFQAFDHLLNERHILKGGSVSASSELLAQFMSYLLQQFIAKMKNAISAKEIMTRIVSHASAAGVRLGEFKDVMLNMLELNHKELSLHECVLRIFKEDVVHFQRLRIQKMRGFVHHSEDDFPSINLPMDEIKSTESADRSGEQLRRDEFKQQSARNSRQFKLRDMRSITKRSQERRGACQPMTQVPASFADFVMDIEDGTNDRPDASLGNGKVRSRQY